MDDQWIIVLGNVVDGVNIYGPFVDYEEACAFGGDSGLEWHATILNSPKPSKRDITSEGAPIQIASHASIYLDEERDYVLFCPISMPLCRRGATRRTCLLRSLARREAYDQIHRYLQNTRGNRN